MLLNIVGAMGLVIALDITLAHAPGRGSAPGPILTPVPSPGLVPALIQVSTF